MGDVWRCLLLLLLLSLSLLLLRLRLRLRLTMTRNALTPIIALMLRAQAPVRRRSRAKHSLYHVLLLRDADGLDVVCYDVRFELFEWEGTEALDWCGSHWETCQILVGGL
jgi:hypothetical protein